MSRCHSHRAEEPWAACAPHVPAPPPHSPRSAPMPSCLCMAESPPAPQSSLLRAETRQTQLTCADTVPARCLACAAAGPPPSLQNPQGPVDVPMFPSRRGRAPPVPQAGTAPTLTDQRSLPFSTQLQSLPPRVPGGGRWQREDRDPSIHRWHRRQPRHRQQPRSCRMSMCVSAPRHGCSWGSQVCLASWGLPPWKRLPDPGSPPGAGAAHLGTGSREGPGPAVARCGSAWLRHFLLGRSFASPLWG